MTYALLASQLAGTVAILAFLPGNLSKAIALLILWAMTFKDLKKYEIIFYIIACIFFSLMNGASLHQGIFAFTEPDLFLMPYWEFFMWGFYLLHTPTNAKGPAPEGQRTHAWTLAIAYSIAFGTIHDQNTLLIVTVLLLTIGLVFFHEKMDLAYTGYMIALGANY